jgi:hypothetical protein
MHGYGRFGRPEALDRHTLLHLGGEMVECLMRSALNGATRAGRRELSSR